MERVDWSLLSRPCFWKIVKVLVQKGEVNLSYLLHETMLNYNILKRCLEDMERVGIVNTLRIGRLKIIGLNWNNKLTPTLYDLVRVMDENLKI
ncbi:MAG: ArsR family transcriptional regulator [Thermoprotei archaeon]|nr:MAG: ArsR family transcriptional regulator [Thermoprotei archaeon]